MSTNSTNSEQGFTLIEVLFATVILTVGLVAMAELMAITLRLQMMGRNETAAVRMAQSKIDELVAIDFDGAAAASVAVGGGLQADVAGYNDNPADGYHRRWQIAAVGGETRIRTLTVRIIPLVVDRRTNAEIQYTTIIRDP